MNLVRDTPPPGWAGRRTKTEAEWTDAHLVPCLDHLLRVGEKRHKLVGVLHLDGRAARLSHLLRLQPLEEGKTARTSHIITTEQKVHKTQEE